MVNKDKDTETTEVGVPSEFWRGCPGSGFITFSLTKSIDALVGKLTRLGIQSQEGILVFEFEEDNGLKRIEALCKFENKSFVTADSIEAEELLSSMLRKQNIHCVAGKNGRLFLKFKGVIPSIPDTNIDDIRS